MPLRSPSERLVRTLCHEAGGLLLLVPIHLLCSGHALGAGAALMVALSILVWLGAHGWGEALAPDLGLTGLCAGCACHFHSAYDRLRPVRRA